ncbi:OmpA family protein [Granulicella pectinivorans]|jgi:outer membrane protein OmpA-like peptidoglycan-associated protein|uniref:OmpA family protein n=1 Tax=Granulicella pectinivorans TaxID=474950 RepID=A0A1I6LNP4_9BACT|nr:OmpA family protein [Granulicella pectinivorans]SFS04872.1 OmpA family protein [Granulicella pectinivorans]
MSQDRIEAEEATNRLSIWLWILPFLAVLAFSVWFVRHHRIAPPTTAPVVTALPQLGNVTYETSKPALDPDGLATVDRAAQVMRGNPNVGLRLEGYPNTSSKPMNQDLLTRQRTESVRKELEAQGIDPNRLVVEPFPPPTPADTDPIPDKAPDTRRISLYIRK